MINNTTLLAQTIISSMITPAFLILGAANLANIALARLGRAVDRVRKLIEFSASEKSPVPIVETWMDRYAARARLAEKAVMAFFAAVGLFVAACLSIAADHYAGGAITWLPVGLTIFGMLVMFCGAIFLGLECRVARGQIHEEISRRIHVG